MTFPELPEGYRFFVEASSILIPRKLSDEEKANINLSTDLLSYEKQTYLNEVYKAVTVSIQVQYEQSYWEKQPKRWWQRKQVDVSKTRTEWRNYVELDPIRVGEVTPERLSEAGTELVTEMENRLAKERQLEYAESLYGAYPPKTLEENPNV